MATAPRTLPGMGLTGAYPIGFKGWDVGMNENLLKLSAIAQLALNQVPTAPLPSSPVDGMVCIDPATKEICVRDAGAWVRVAPRVGWIATYETTLYRFQGSDWAALVGAGLPILGALANGSDFNNLTSDGVSFVNSNASAATMLNMPPGMQQAGTLYTGRLSTSGLLLTQLYVTYQGGIAARGSSGGVYGAWRIASQNGQAASFPNIQLGNVLSSNANTLDYYEEGTWTPVLVGSTTPGSPVYGNQGGRYSRIGNMVQLTGTITISSKGGLAGAIRVSGLPFPVATPSSRTNSPVSFGYLTGLNLATAHQVSAFASGGASLFAFYKTPMSGNAGGLIDTEISDSFGFYFSMTYGV